MKENRLWYPAPAGDWNEALPLGNGILGMMVFGGVKEERVQLNEETFWSGWEHLENDSPKTYEHLDEIRSLIFEGKYTEAQKLTSMKINCVMRSLLCQSLRTMWMRKEMRQSSVSSFASRSAPDFGVFQ